MRVLLVAHGFPPRESAGTEQHTAAVARELKARGHSVLVIAATRAPGARHAAIRREPGVVRVVNNLPARPLQAREQDRAIEAAVEAEAARFRPDVVHIHHLQFLSSQIRFAAPTVLTLHDAWTWCAAGGTLLHHGAAPCPGPEPARCAPCAAAWAPVPGRRAQLLLRAAGALRSVVPTDTLHAAYQRVPDGLRAPIRRGRADVGSPAHAADRNAAFRALLARARITAPSEWLAGKARAALGLPVRVVPHGIEGAPLPRAGDGPLLFLGTLAAHKGPDRVVRAWRAAFPLGEPGLALHGPVADRGLALGHPVGGPLDRAGVWRALSTARALVLASRWEENAPLVLLEARAAGCPVVAPRQGGIPELIEHGVDGLLYEPDQPGALEAALRAVVRQRFSPRPPRRAADQLDEYVALYREARS